MIRCTGNIISVAWCMVVVKTLFAKDALWCGVVWCVVVWCGVVWCGVVWCGVVWCGVGWCCVVWRRVVWCGVVWCGVVWYWIGVVPVVVCMSLYWWEIISGARCVCCCLECAVVFT